MFKCDGLSFETFADVATMPYAVSDFTVTTFEGDVFHDVNHFKGPRMYVIGGCITNQVCIVANTTTNALNCYCEGITNKCIYFLPEYKQWYPCASAPTPRYRHMGE